MAGQETPHTKSSINVKKGVVVRTRTERLMSVRPTRITYFTICLNYPCVGSSCYYMTRDRFTPSLSALAGPAQKQHNISSRVYTKGLKVGSRPEIENIGVCNLALRMEVIV